MNMTKIWGENATILESMELDQTCLPSEDMPEEYGKVFNTVSLDIC